MVKIHSLDDLTAIVGDAAGALTVMTDCVGTTVDSWAPGSKSECELDQATLGTLDVIRELFDAGMTEVLEQSGITVQAADLGRTVLRDADIDGGAAVQTAEV
ncbi:hypothetical protein HGA13_17105 [Nocardia speluncae]|uniref:Uncharacterized protein n=1 Tax=Nocardia speluncae TaxID=419477 RepID=A0A846XJE3_9NOCA|nr:hypothetical protein [Nocardia speluncae]NKY34780.1 hypothetical protein [Nocardia speluncae]